MPLAAFLAVDVCPGILLDAACCCSWLKSALHRNEAEVHNLHRYISNDAPDSWLISAHTCSEQRHRHARLTKMARTLRKQMMYMLCCSRQDKDHIL